MKRSQFLNNIFRGVAADAIMPAFSFCSSDSSGKKIPGSNNRSPGFSPDVDDVELIAVPAELHVLTGIKNKPMFLPKLNILAENDVIVFARILFGAGFSCKMGSKNKSTV